MNVKIYSPGDIIVLNSRSYIWSGIICRLIEKDEVTGQWKMENLYGSNKYTVYYREQYFSPYIS